MKLIVILFSLILFGSYQTETYYIIKVKGDIVNLNSGKHLSQGDAILATDELKFSDKDAMALVISDTRGRFKLKFPENKDNDKFEFTSFVKSALVGTNKIQFSTRSIITNAAIKDLKEFLGDDEFTVIGNSLEVKLNEKDFSNQKIIAKYDRNGNLIDKNLVGDDNTFSLSRNILGVKAYGEAKLYHVDFYKLKTDDEQIEKITRLDVNFIDKATLQDEFKTIIGVYKKKEYTQAQMKAFLMEYFIDFYGNTHLYFLSEFVEKVITENMN
ncbi:MAG: hypothetical protein P1P88_07345 [Bacteroidales bacterium]|nr:hypothetical protein [Bacteroidales bacterium]